MIYLAGPYLSKDLHTHKMNIGRLLCYYIHLSRFLEDLIICPPLMTSGFNHGTPWLAEKDYLAKCLESIPHMDELFVTPAYQSSEGTNIEISRARDFEVPINFLAEFSSPEVVDILTELRNIKSYNPLNEFGFAFLSFYYL